jgi:hypothetical protein
VLPSTGIGNKHRINARNTDIHALSGIRTHDPSVRASRDSSCLRPRGHCDRHHGTTSILDLKQLRVCVVRYDVNCYVIVEELLDSILNTRQEPKRILLSDVSDIRWSGVASFLLLPFNSRERGARVNWTRCGRYGDKNSSWATLKSNTRSLACS